MALSDELVSQFAKLMKPEEDKTQESTLYGKFVIHNGKKYVQLDGSELLTPVEQTATAKEGDRVSVTIKNHNATVTGNYSSPAARSGDVDENSRKILEIGTIVADKASIEDLKATNATVENLVADNATIKSELKAANATIETISADNVTIKETIKANKAAIDDLDANKLSANVADLKYATVESLEATNADVHNLSADYGEFKQATIKDLTAKEATIQKLETEKLSATDADLKYANIDFSNIGKAAIEQFYATSGIIKDLVIGDTTVTGELVGVTIKGDLIEGGTVVADKLVIKGQNGLYYKLNTDGVTTEAEQTDYNSLNGSIITAKSITATKVNVDDLVAFDATIGGFNITDNAIYSGVKSSVDNTTRGIYQDKDGQIAFGDGSNYLKYFKDSDGKYKLEISAASLKFSASNKSLETALGETITKTVEEFYLSSSPTSLSGGSWSSNQPTWTEGKYIWRRTAVTYGDGSSEYTPSPNGVCITGNTGAKGDTGAKGETGAAGKGVKSTAVAYQVGASGTTVPTGTWSTSVPAADTSKPYLWTRTIITYTDNTTSTSYSVGATPEGMVQKKKIISEINLSEEEISIKAEKISLEGLVTANENFKVLTDGSIEAKNGKFTGEIHATSGKFEGEIVSSKATITGGSMIIKAADDDYKAIDIYWGNPNTQGEDGYYTTQISPGLVYGYGYNGGHSGSFRLDFDGLTLTGAGANIHCIDITATGAINGRYWNWSGQGGQPSWLWGGNDGVNMYVYNPSNFSVNYAKTAGAVTNLGTVYARDTSNTYSLTGSGQWITLASVTLPAGVYVGYCWTKISGTPQSRMILIFSNSNSETNAGARSMSDDNMDRACCTTPIALNLGSQTTMYLRVYTSLGATRAILNGWYIVRIK